MLNSQKTKGVELMERINEGRLQVVASPEMRRIRDSIVFEMEELLEVGARIRPLYSGNERIGWVRGVHLSERKQLKRYSANPLEVLGHVLRIGTTVPKETLKDLSALELRSLLRVVTEMTNSDLRLYPYLSAFVTTSTSEQLWFSRGTELSSFQKKNISLPDGSDVQLISAPDQARLWATLCSYREHAKQRLDASINTLMMLRPWAGKGADGLAAELKNTSRSLQPDQMEAWVEVVKTPRAIDISDGWAHGEDDSREGILRELHGMMSNDRHEQVMAQLEKGIREEAERNKREAEARMLKSGGPGFVDQVTEFLTPKQIRERVERIRADRSRGLRVNDDLGSNAAERLDRYE